MSQQARKFDDDSQARQDSLTIDSSIIVQAPAGSGKTELLVQRYLKLLASACDNPRQIIAITFTRKAAAEMCARIRTELQRSQEPQEAHKKITYELAQQVLIRAKEKNWDLDRLISQDTVTTIDAFCRFLVALDPVKGNFFTMPDILESTEADKLYEQAVAQSIRTAQQSEMREELKELIYIHSNDLNQFKQNFSQLLKQRAPLLLAIMKKDNDLQVGIGLLCQELLTKINSCAPFDILAAIAQPSQQAIEDWQKQQTDTPLLFNAIPSDYDWQTADLPAWQNLARLLLTSGGSLRKRINKRIGFSPKTDHKEAMESLLEELAQQASPQPDGHPSPTGEFLYYLARTHGWSNCYQPEELQLAEAAAQFFKLTASQLQQLFKTQGKCDYVEIMLAALEVMEQDYAPSLLAERLGYQLRHILVDEFQDTSIGQLRLLESLSRSWDASTPNTLFLVGDPMQSIYAFRQADVRIFNQLWQNKRLGQVELVPLVLKRNFRSQGKLVDWCNKRFATIFPPVADNIIDSVVHTSATATHPAEGEAVRLLGLKQKKEGSDSDSKSLFMPIISEIKELAQQPATIAILAPSRNHISELIPLLQEERLDFNAGQITPSSANRHIMDLLSLTRALYDWNDELSWYACLRAPWCGLELADLLFISQNKKKESIWQYLRQLAQTNSQLLKAAKSIHHFVHAIEPIVNRIRRSNWSDLVLSTWNNLGGPLLLATEQDQYDTELFFSLLQENSKGALIDIDSLTEQLTSQGAVFENNSQIQLMTIHKSKGLEFDYVFLPMIHKGWGNSSIEILLTTDFHSNQAKREFSLFAIHSPSSEIQKEPGYSMLSQLKKEKEVQEYRRLFYVACTRAKKRLYLHYLIRYDDKDKANAPGSNSFASLLWPQIQEDLCSQLKPLTANQPAQSNGNEFPLLKRVSEFPPVKTPTAKEDKRPASLFSWSPPQERAQGLLVHKFLDVITKMNPKADQIEKEPKKFLAAIHRQDYERELSEEGFDDSQIEKLISEALKAVRQTLADKRGRWLLSRPGKSEWQLNRQGKLPIRIDRTFIEDDTRWIVDYKTSATLPFSQQELNSFHNQLNLYAEALAAIDKHPIMLAIYCPQDNYWQEWEYQSQQSPSDEPLEHQEFIQANEYDNYE